MNRLLSVFVVAAVALAVPAAPPQPPVAKPEPIPEMHVEFDKKAHQNPSRPVPGTVTATGVCSVPKGCKLLGVDVLYKKAADPIGGPWTVLTTTVDLTADPVAWKVTKAGIAAGEYQFRADVKWVGLDGKEHSLESYDWRKVMVQPAPANPPMQVMNTRAKS